MGLFRLCLALGLVATQAQMPPPPANGVYDDDSDDSAVSRSATGLPEPQAGQQMDLLSEPTARVAPQPVGRKGVNPNVLGAVKLMAATPEQPKMAEAENIDMTKPELNFKHGRASFQPDKCKPGAWGSCEQKALADVGGGVYNAPSGEGNAAPPLPSQEVEKGQTATGTSGQAAPTMLYAAKPFKISIRVPNWAPLQIWVEDTYTARTTKAILESKFNIRNTRLWYNYAEVKDETRLKDAGIGPDAIVNVVVRCQKAE